MTELEEGSVAARAAVLIQGAFIHVVEVEEELEHWRARREEVLVSARDEWAKLYQSFQEEFGLIGLAPEVPTVEESSSVASGASWSFGGVRFTLGNLQAVETPNPSLRFDVMFSAELNLELENQVEDYRGSAASLWYGDLSSAGSFAWHHLEFTDSLPRQSLTEPQALSPSDAARTGALDVGITAAEIRLEGFEPLADEERRLHIVRTWRDLFAAAVVGEIQRPEARYPVELPR
jgi:hypothetical protein